MRACVVQFVQFEAERRFASRAVERVEASGFENKEFTLPCTGMPVYAAPVSYTMII